MLKKPRHVTITKIFGLNISSSKSKTMTTFVCPSQLLSLSWFLTEKYSVQKSWWWKQKYLFLSEGLAVWRLSRNQFKPVWSKTVKNYPARKLELLSPQNRYISHQCGIWKIMGKAIFFCKRVFIDLSSCESAKGNWNWAKITVFQIHINNFLYWQN